ncbi:MAG: hypothetical protein ACI845_000455 [Gammaproteobacteria bacterium]
MKLESVSAADVYANPTHTVTVTLPRAIDAGDGTLEIQLTGTYSVELTTNTVILKISAGPTTIDFTADATGMGSTSIAITIDESNIGSPALAISPTIAAKLSVTQDTM